MSEIPGSKCQCVLRNGLMQEIEEMQAIGIWQTLSPNTRATLTTDAAKGACPKPADSETGEAMLCLGCWENHKEANMVPKRLPKREVVYGSRA